MKDRLQKIMSQAGICSRRQAEKYIQQGQVSVDGAVVSELGAKFDPEKHRIEFNGKPVSIPRKKVYPAKGAYRV